MRYYYDDQRVLLETDATSTEHDVRYFIYGNFVDEVLIMTDVDSGNSVADGDYYYGHDHLFSPAVLFSSAGAPVERYEYDAYGTARIYNADFTTLKTASDYNNPYYFTGRRLDTLDGGDLNIMYYRARTYDTVTGRFGQRDPLGIDPAGQSTNPFTISQHYNDGMNLYEYCGGLPSSKLDPFGMSWYWKSDYGTECSEWEKKKEEHKIKKGGPLSVNAWRCNCPQVGEVRITSQSTEPRQTKTTRVAWTTKGGRKKDKEGCKRTYIEYRVKGNIIYMGKVVSIDKGWIFCSYKLKCISRKIITKKKRECVVTYTPSTISKENCNLEYFQNPEIWK